MAIQWVIYDGSIISEKEREREREKERKREFIFNHTLWLVTSFSKLVLVQLVTNTTRLIESLCDTMTVLSVTQWLFFLWHNDCSFCGSNYCSGIQNGIYPVQVLASSYSLYSNTLFNLSSGLYSHMIQLHSITLFRYSINSMTDTVDGPNRYFPALHAGGGATSKWGQTSCTLSIIKAFWKLSKAWACVCVYDACI